MLNATRSVFCELRNDLYEDCNFSVLFFSLCDLFQC